MRDTPPTIFKPDKPVHVRVEDVSGNPLPCQMHGVMLLPPEKMGHLMCWSVPCYLALWQEGMKLLRYGPLIPSRLIPADYERICRAERLKKLESLRTHLNDAVRLTLTPHIYNGLVAMARRAGVSAPMMAKLIINERVETEIILHARRLKQRRMEAMRAERERAVETGTSE